MKISVSLLLLRGIMGTFEGCRGTPREARQKKSPLTSTPSGILSDGFICDCDHTGYCEEQ